MRKFVGVRIRRSGKLCRKDFFLILYRKWFRRKKLNKDKTLQCASNEV